MSDTKTDEATKTYTPERQAGEWMPAVVLDEQAERIQELERREALLTADLLAHMAFLEARADLFEHGEDEDWIHAVDGPFVVATHRLSETHTALTEAGFPWPAEPVDGETEAARDGRE